MKPSSTIIDVVCGVIRNESGEILACQRPQGKHLAGLWEFPGGKVDPGESPEVALIRELQEELSVTVSVGEALTPVFWDYGDRSICLHPFMCNIIRGELLATEHEALLWCTEQNFSSLSWAEADLPILDEVFSRHPK